MISVLPPPGTVARGKLACGFLLLGLAACSGEPPTDVPLTIAPLGNRSTIDRPAEVAGRQIHVIYMIPADGADAGLDTTGALERSVGLFQSWFAARTGMWLRRDTYEGSLDISFVQSSRSNGANASLGTQLLSRLYAEVRSAGFNRSDTKYLIYYDGSNPLTCGNAMQNGPAAALYLRGSVSGTRCGQGSSFNPGIRPGYWEFAMLHEAIHTLGMVDSDAPHHDDSRPWHVQDGADLMHGGGGYWYPTLLDRDNDDYYGPAVPSGVRNLMNDPILIPVPPGFAAGDIDRQGDQRPLPPFHHQVTVFREP